MYNITDITSLGTEYTIADTSGNVITSMQVIPFLDILDATMGPYTDDLGSYTDYIEKSIALLSGFDEIDQDSVLWWATSDEEVQLSDVIEYAVENGYKTIILEHLDEIDE